MQFKGPEHKKWQKSFIIFSLAQATTAAMATTRATTIMGLSGLPKVIQVLMLLNSFDFK
jgi:hypothetical protein